MDSKQVAIVTGGASGIGAALSTRLVGKGWTVVIADRNKEVGDAVASSLGCTFIAADVASYSSQAELFQRTWNEFGQIDLVLANAGTGEDFDFFQTSSELPPPELPLPGQHVNLNGVEYSAYLGMHYMRKNPNKGGNIIMASSIAGIYSIPAVPIYTAAKYGVVGLTRALGLNLAKGGIRVNCVMPGPVRTNLCTKEAFDMFPQDVFTTAEQIVDAAVHILEGHTLSGMAVEVSQGKVYHRKQHEFLDDKTRKLMGMVQGDSGSFI